MGSILTNGVVTGAGSKSRFAIGRSVAKRGSEAFANNYRDKVRPVSPSSRLALVAGVVAAILGAALALAI